jgi:xanthine dehydrogenase accessory factor
VVVIDHMPVLSAEPNTLITDLDYDLGKFEFGPTDSVVVLTKGERDIKTLEAISSAKVRFVGLLASQQRVKDDLETLRTKGVSTQFIQSIHAPIGVDIGAVAPEEIALSIMTDIVATRHGKHLPHKTVSEVAPKTT